jgi:hypothetical protein
MTLHTLVNISDCVTCVDFGACMLSITHDMSVCVHCSAIKCLHCKIVLRDVGIPNILNNVCYSSAVNYNTCILARNQHITTRFGNIVHIYILFLCAELCSFWSETKHFIEKKVRKYLLRRPLLYITYPYMSRNRNTPFSYHSYYIYHNNQRYHIYSKVTTINVLL